MNRIKVIDGFRTIAVLGVLWAHIWMFAGAPSGKFMGIEFARLMSFFGTGVDLFFVISGFCMYLMYVSRQTHFTFSYYFSYLKKRWLRIAPAFYAAIIFYGLFNVWFNIFLFDTGYALKNAFFIKNLFPDITQYAPHFWSLCTEWHFYLVLPFIVYGIHHFPFYKTIFLLFLCSLIFRFFIWIPNNDPFNIINYSIANRLVEFLAGILAARIYLDGRKERIFQTTSGLIIGVAVAFTGRFLMSADMQERTDMIGLSSRMMNLPLLTAGFALVIINALQHRTWFAALMETRIFTSIGKYSYSMYLWHWVIADQLTRYCIWHWSFSPFLQVNLIFLMSVTILYPVSILSYKMFESFYFINRKQGILRKAELNK